MYCSSYSNTAAEVVLAKGGGTGRGFWVEHEKERGEKAHNRIEHTVCTTTSFDCADEHDCYVSAM